MNNYPATSKLKILRINEVVVCTGLSKSTIYDKLNPRSPRHDPTFPKQKKLGVMAVGWLECDINFWLENLPGSVLNYAPNAKKIAATSPI